MVYIADYVRNINQKRRADALDVKKENSIRGVVFGIAVAKIIILKIARNVKKILNAGYSKGEKLKSGRRHLRIC